MTSTDKLRCFDSALQVIAAAANLNTRADQLTVKHSAFRSFSELVTCHRNYRPTISMATPEQRELADVYDAAQTARGDARRAFRYGVPVRRGSLLDRDNYRHAEYWYALGTRRAFWDRHTRQWIVTTVDSAGNQVGCADFYPNSGELLKSEHCH